ncbi:MAG: hypothetical protein K5829_14400 [Treponema sp.]|nr:hypothetical protein [Treponema sp.]
MKKKIITTLLIALLSGFLFAEENNTEIIKALDAKNGVGVSYFSPEIGISDDESFLGGLCYQHWFTNKIGLETGGAVSWNPSSDTYSDPLNYNIFVEGDYVLFKSEPSDFFASRLFAWTVLGHVGSIVSEYDSESESYKQSEFFPNFRAGLGFGFDLIFFRHISIPLKFGFTGSRTGAGFTFGGGIKYIW